MSVCRLLIIGTIWLILGFVGPTAGAVDFQTDEGLTAAELRDSLSRTTSLSSEQIESLVSEVQKQFGASTTEIIPIRGYLFAHGMNVGVLIDHDVWKFDAVLKAPGSEELVTVRDLFLCDFHNGGLKLELAYKWMFTFIPSGIDVKALNGAIFGRGLGVVFDPILGIEGSWMPGKNRNQDLFHVALKLGLGGGIIFPKMEFKLRSIKAATI